MKWLDRFKSDRNAPEKSSLVKFSRNDIKIDRVGEGISGSVELFRSKATPTFRYAVKTYHSKEKYETKDEYVKRVLGEYNILKQLHHSNLIQAYKYEVSLSGEVRTYLQAGSPNLFQLLKHAPHDKSTWTGMLCLWKQVCEGIRYLHGLNICHRDLKLENLIVDLGKQQVKIIDFATAMVIHDNEEAIGLVGSDSYIAPETIEKIRYDGKEADIWSLGIILYYLLNLRFAWKSARHSDKKYIAFKDIPPRSQEWIELMQLPPAVYTDEGYERGKAAVLRYLPDESFSLAGKIFEVDPTKRANIDTFYNNKWFQSIKHCTEDGQKCGADHSSFFRDHKKALLSGP
ncbi:kinase-like domain-containing protein [Scheffersomyces xylosifermentans]|uniref:kinase-like domain-containing protein n=1 Tax=Scheffersomyces xylosifermentans TaxID=1304137 RepID=UPI00315C6AA3